MLRCETLGLFRDACQCHPARVLREPRAQPACAGGYCRAGGGAIHRPPIAATRKRIRRFGLVARALPARARERARTIRPIAPFPPGGGVDLTARLLAEPSGGQPKHGGKVLLEVPAHSVADQCEECRMALGDDR